MFGRLLPPLLVLLGVVAGWAAWNGGPSARTSGAASCETPLDIVLVIDGSGSIFGRDFTTVKGFSKDFVDSFVLSDTAARVGVVQFSGEGEGRVEIGLSGSAAAVKSAVDNMVQLEGYTDIQEGLAIGQGEIAANGRPGVPHVIILLTDGQQEGAPGDPVAEAENARNAGTEIFAIGVGGGPNIDQLNAIASDPDSTHVFAVEDFDSLAAVRAQLVATACPTPTPGGATATPTPQTTPTPTAPEATSTPGSTPAPGPTATPKPPGGGANDTPGTCTKVTPDVKVHAGIDPAGDVDYYCLTGGSGQKLTLDIDAESGGSQLDATLTLIGKDGLTVLAEDDDTHGLDPYISFVLPNAGTYYVLVEPYGSPCACGGPDQTYVLYILLSGGAPPPTPTPTSTPVPTATPTPPGGGANDSPGTCTPVTPDAKVHAAIDPAGDVDYYCVTGGAGQKLTLDIDASSGGSPLDATLALIGKDGVTVLAEDDDTHGLDPYISFVLPDAGTYYVRVQPYGSPCLCGGPEDTYVLYILLAGGAPQTPTATPTRTPTATRTPTPLPPASTPSIPGDVNCDGRVNAIDAAYVLQYGAGLAHTLPCPNKGDVNRDGRIDALDAALILQYGAGLLHVLPV